MARLLGFLYGDGWINTDKQVGFSGQVLDLEQVNADLKTLGDRGHIFSERYTVNEDKGIAGWGAQFCSNYIYPMFKDLHPMGKKVFQPLRVPESIKSNKSYVKAAFLSGLFSAEGTGIEYQTNERTLRPVVARMFSTKEEWINNWFSDIGELLSELEIRYTYRSSYKEDIERYIGEISVCNEKTNIVKFINKIGFCYNADKTVSLNTYKLFRAYETIWKRESWKKNRKIHSTTGSCIDIAKKLNLPLSTVKYHKNLYDTLYSNSLLTPKEYIDKIRWKGNYVKLPILREGVRSSDELVNVYNLTSGADNRFFAGGFFTHNCEEMDYIDENALQSAVLPILHTTPQTTLVGFSTPSGFKTPYYQMCTENPTYKEFYYSYKVLPWWRQVEAEKSSFTEEQWKREYLAEFADAEFGVYKPSYIDRSLIDYEYNNMTRNVNWKYTIGADWNEKYGTELVVLGYNPFTQVFQLVEANHIEKSEFTQLAGVSRLLELNKKWKPAFIYVDAGNGSSNVELLRKTAFENSTSSGDRDTARLLQILKKYDAGSAIETRDPISHQKVKAQAKPFMVNSSVRLFEQNKIKLSVHDNKLEKQLRNYIIERLSPTKVPVYGLSEPKVGDHRLDALNLAIVAFTLEFDDLHARHVSMDVGAVADPRSLKSSEDKNGRLEEIRYSRPEERRIDSPGLTWAEQEVFGKSNPGKMDLQHIPTNRPGWSTDEEDKVRQDWIHRRRSRGNSTFNRPKRSNF
jgi:hypothetical protein